MFKQEYLCFALDSEEYAVELNSIKGVVHSSKITRVPNVDPFVKGVINLRGLMVPVVDLREKLGLTPKEYSKIAVIILIEGSGRIMGIIVDAIPDMVEISPEELQPPFYSQNLRGKEYIKILGRKESRLIIILDPDKIIPL
ncbi:MAG: chemotaxis protein CheW [Pseudomonadota bacterium]